ncbi:MULTISPECIES: ParB/RepB/Spo0J family partition protein [Streptomyces]|uniref:ParB/RepB/Spo0J family partition protein n=1 Tax=Streptomyces lycopersici TaxID=2974589 RepID=UPI0021D11CB0|nr:winged helix-turn-helix transcriptional regulator [Streptomyces sp. NEAU-383]
MESVALRALSIAGSPRSTIESPDHTRALAELDGQLPPILVHRDSMTVIDGIHRLRAAELQGRTHIDVRYFEGTAADGRLLAVALNVAHGLPLSLEERTTAAQRILTLHPEWSDRSVASLAGLSPKKAADIRRSIFGGTVAGDKRMGRDGRARPLDPSQGRALAAFLLKENPTASLRQIAKEVGISPTTVADVRDRIARGESPALPEALPQKRSSERRHPRRQTPAVSSPPSDIVPVTELTEILQLLHRDPSLRLNDAGRSVLRLLDASAAFARNRESIAASLPPHCTNAMAKLAQGYSHSWQLLADQLRDLSDGQ